MVWWCRLALCAGVLGGVVRLCVGVRVEVVVGRAFGAVAGCEILASECARVRG